MNILDRKFSSVFSSFNPDIVIHLAAQIDVTQSKINPIFDAENNIIAELVSGGNVSKFVYANSGGAIYSKNDTGIYTESSQIGPKSPYGISKYVGELYSQNIILPEKTKFVSLRLANVYGDPSNESKSSGVISKWLDAINTSREIEIRHPHASRDFVYVEDVADAIHLLSTNDFAGIYNVGSGFSSSLTEVSTLIRRLLFNEFEITFTSLGSEEVMNSQLCICRIKELTKWMPSYTLEDGLTKMIYTRKNLILRSV